MVSKVANAEYDECDCLDALLGRLSASTRDCQTVALGTVVDAIGRRSFAPLLLVAGLIAVSPLSGIPGTPTLVAAVVSLIAGQLLIGRRQFWLPGWLMRRSISHRRFDQLISVLRPVARVVDRVLRPRLTALTHDFGARAIALVCLAIALSMPPLELLPFAGTLSGAALSAFALALIAHDGLVALLALVFTATLAAPALVYVL